jgi:hypothetical protein
VVWISLTAALSCDASSFEERVSNKNCFIALGSEFE